MATTQQRLDDAESALHDLLTGRAVRVFVDQNGERVEYNSANRGALAAYVAELKRSLGTPIQGPMQVFL